jgi:hypothetical protein
VGAGSSVTSISRNEEAPDKAGEIMKFCLRSPSLDLGVNADILTTKDSKNQKHTGGLMIGLRAGYRFSTLHNNWKDEKGDRIDNQPSQRNNSFYITVVAGVGYFQNK